MDEEFAIEFYLRSLERLRQLYPAGAPRLLTLDAAETWLVRMVGIHAMKLARKLEGEVHA